MVHILELFEDGFHFTMEKCDRFQGWKSKYQDGLGLHILEFFSWLKVSTCHGNISQHWWQFLRWCDVYSFPGIYRKVRNWTSQIDKPQLSLLSEAKQANLLLNKTHNCHSVCLKLNRRSTFEQDSLLSTGHYLYQSDSTTDLSEVDLNYSDCWS